MLNKLDSIFPSQKRSIPTPDEKNYVGGPSYNRSLEEKTLTVLMAGVFENTYYASQKELVTQAVDLFKQMALTDAELFARMIVYARNKGFIRVTPITALVVLSTADLNYFELAFPLVIRTPGDLQDFMQIIRSGVLRKGCGRAVKRVIGNWMNNLSEYHVIKYGSQGAKFSLRDILRLVHPQPATIKANALFSYLCNGVTKENVKLVRELLPQVKAMELLKRETDPEQQRQFITEGRLPYETVVGAIKPDVALWTELMQQMPYFALLRHLNILYKAGVFNNKTNVKYVVGRLTDEKQIRGSKALPFRFFSAYHTMVQGMPRAVTEALETALETSFQNVPTLTGRTAVACDVSASMSCPISEKSKVRFIDIATIFSAAMLKKTEDALILPFDLRLHMERFSASDTVMTTARVMATTGGGGTNLSLPIDYLIKGKIVVDTFVGITDSESWAGQDFLSVWREYRKTVAPNAKAFLIHIAPYTHSVAPQNEPDVWYFYGWSDSVLPFISMTVNGEMTQLDAVRTTDLVSTTASIGDEVTNEE